MIFSIQFVEESFFSLNDPNVDSLMDALVMFNMPFTFVKGLTSTLLTLAVYKYISPILKHGTKQKSAKQAG